MGEFISGALVGLVAGILFGTPIWNWIKGTANKVKDTVEKNQTTKP
jgi:Na+/glutamate symporter